MREAKTTAGSAQDAQNPPKLMGFLRELIKTDLARGTDDCRRQFKRHALRTSLNVQPLTSDFQPDGEPFEAISSDISFRGMAFVYPDPLNHEFVRITFNNYDITAIAQMKHNSSIGVDYPLFLVGVEFLEEYYEE